MAHLLGLGNVADDEEIGDDEEEKGNETVEELVNDGPQREHEQVPLASALVDVGPTGRERCLEQVSGLLTIRTHFHLLELLHDAVQEQQVGLVSRARRVRRAAHLHGRCHQRSHVWIVLADEQLAQLAHTVVHLHELQVPEQVQIDGGKEEEERGADELERFYVGQVRGFQRLVHGHEPEATGDHDERRGAVAGQEAEECEQLANEGRTRFDVQVREVNEPVVEEPKVEDAEIEQRQQRQVKVDGEARVGSRADERKRLWSVWPPVSEDCC